MNKEKMQLIWQYIVLKHLRKPKWLGMDNEGRAPGMMWVRLTVK